MPESRPGNWLLKPNIFCPKINSIKRSTLIKVKIINHDKKINFTYLKFLKEIKWAKANERNINLKKPNVLFREFVKSIEL
tara:strand:- start:49 stop:288 length:240 start_codon:yes stop_codon:yes gene_type:complete